MMQVIQNLRFASNFNHKSSLAQNRTGISSSGDLRTIHCTTRPLLPDRLDQTTKVRGKDLNGNSQQNYAKKLTDSD